MSNKVNSSFPIINPILFFLYPTVLTAKDLATHQGDQTWLD